MRRLAGLLVVPLLLLSTVACGSDDKGSDSTSSKNGLPAITAGAKFGQKPTLAKGEGDPPKELKVDVVSKGDGATTKKGDVLQVNYLGQTWVSDKPFDNSFDTKQPLDLTLGAGNVIPGWEKALEGQKVGSRLEMSIPPGLAYGDQAKGDQIPANSTLVFVVDILKATTLPVSAKGTEVAQDNIDLPKVGTNTDGKAPSVTFPKKSDPPKKLVSNYVIEGTGPVLTAKDTVVVKYEAYLWNGAKKFDSTYQAGKTQTFPLAQVTLKGLKDGLIGKKVGSRVLLVIPPDQAFGAEEKQGIPKNSTLVFAVDLLTKM
ncbi:MULTISPECIES: FKBP-type peptidyl-prolyl cis-trans isomerase [unclassified Streptomyces]|uniref:FKBP-type peptidyl-prolyl cis-trans isomerase n=1 Tax=unclassified Streptomyces TaxID=2593676 RepID=UPI002DD9EDF0|nr:FKBP-type peptidyl-prolyl cis-trans isomerase [Streptomyces sp. NBC_01750]WSB03847.1 FKBP-type peptidyl-prolyl cis-trans isomerase [Streptomyces sp. NBC_01794]WSD31865.1 FKBP-type peptidyl-prolyl cis-trans isomerase [Streptomyces sp. NBC_01750]